MRTQLQKLAGLSLTILLAADLASAQTPSRPTFTGVNIAGGEFGKLGGRYGYDYIYFSDADIDFVVAAGFNTVRLPFLWERLQPKLGEPLDQIELALIEDSVQRAEKKGLTVVLDPHNYGRYRDQPVGSDQVPIESFAGFWRALAEDFKHDPHLVFGLMNEPHDMSTEVWAQAAQAALTAIREVGASNLVLVPGNAYSSAHSWSAEGYGTPNAVAMATISDPCGNMAFEFHQYLDEDSSGTHPACRDPKSVVEGLDRATKWLTQTKNRGFLAEFGASTEPACVAGLEGMLRSMSEDSKSWIGWTYWASGSWWTPSYQFSIGPGKAAARPQMRVLKSWRNPHLPKADAACRGPNHVGEATAPTILGFEPKSSSYKSR